MTLLSLAQRILAIDESLEGIPHAFGGALALAYYAEPRATIDIDLNVFLPPERIDAVADRLVELGATVDATARKAISVDGQGRAMWDGVPIDLFFAYDSFHSAAAAAVREVPFADATIPVLSPEHLLVCKVIFDRPKDWVDIEAVLDAGTPIDAAEVVRWVGRIAGDDDHRYVRAVAVLTSR
ncbi:MAG TPA: nucleotidyl transferase AbiEii/AbiGii toxin family protein [Acidimicrobiales bacterium]|nr:nucleotidyl transferase AbiEii/AbiGii toxin family protein [Acidimicrobiales bacterium]